VKEKVPGNVERDFLAQMVEDLDIDALQLQTALIFDRTTRSQDGRSFAAKVGPKE
jgi:hypothetical protein